MEISAVPKKEWETFQAAFPSSLVQTKADPPWERARGVSGVGGASRARPIYYLGIPLQNLIL